jgi:hypothetical protein
MTKRLLGWIMVLGLPLLGIAAYKTVKESFLNERVDKNISFNLYRAGSYTAKIYDSTAAEIEIRVEKVNGKSRTQVWDTTFGPRMLRKYPSIEKALSKTITVADVLERKEHLEISYVITYDSKGNILQMQDGPYVLNDLEEINICL